jgi:hypothetical protein
MPEGVDAAAAGFGGRRQEMLERDRASPLPRQRRVGRATSSMRAHPARLTRPRAGP